MRKVITHYFQQEEWFQLKEVNQFVYLKPVEYQPFLKNQQKISNLYSLIIDILNHKEIQF